MIRKGELHSFYDGESTYIFKQINNCINSQNLPSLKIICPLLSKCRNVTKVQETMSHTISRTVRRFQINKYEIRSVN